MKKYKIALSMLLCTIIAASLVLANASIFKSSFKTVEAFAKNEVIGENIYFSRDDFTSRVTDRATLKSIVISSLPNVATGSLVYESQPVSIGDTINIDDISKLCFKAEYFEEIVTSFTFIPVFTNGRGSENVTVLLNILEQENHAPVSYDTNYKTFKNISICKEFNTIDRDNDELTYKIVKSANKGTVSIEGDTFTYSPFTNKGGKDSFTFTACDKYGNVSNEATVTINIDKSKLKFMYSDMDTNTSHYASLKLAEEGIFTGLNIGGEYFFEPDKEVTRAEFVAMIVTALDMDSSTPVMKTGFYDDDSTPAWAKPYVLNALKAGIIQGITTVEGRKVFNSSQSISLAEATVIINNALNFTKEIEVSNIYDDVPAWAETAVYNLDSNNVIDVSNMAMDNILTRATAAELICSALEYKSTSETKYLFSWALQ